MNYKPSDRIMRIGISFGDNDFYFTFMPMMEAIAAALTMSHPGNQPLTKSQIVEIINGLAYPFYRLCQNRWRHGDGGDDHIRNYLRITEDRVYINEEIDKKLEDPYWCNGEFFYVDIDSGQTGCY